MLSNPTATRRTFVAAAAMAGLAAVASTVIPAAHADEAAAADTASDVPAPASTVELGHVNVYDCGEVKLHAFCTGDALGDECYLVESADSLVAIELPAFESSLDAYKSYVDGLGKPVAGLFVDAHPTGASVLEGVPVYATEAAKAAIEGGSTNATTLGLGETFGAEFRSDDLAQATDVVEEGPIEVGGIQFEVQNAAADTYDLVIPAANAVYTHMLGGTCHSIMPSVDAMDAMVSTLEGYQQAGYTFILSAHCEPEGQKAVADKIAYVENVKEIAASSTDAAGFIAAMDEAYPDYAGHNYLEMTASYLFPEA